MIKIDGRGAWLPIDTEVWDRIATALEQATPWTAMLSRIDYPVIWSEVVTAIDQATRTRANACKAKPDDLPLTRRRDAIAAIVALMFIDVMAELRAPPPLKDAA